MRLFNTAVQDSIFFMTVEMSVLLVTSRAIRPGSVSIARTRRLASGLSIGGSLSNHRDLASAGFLASEAFPGRTGVPRVRGRILDCAGSLPRRSAAKTGG
jgi:hypothetical protein